MCFINNGTFRIQYMKAAEFFMAAISVCLSLLES